MYACNVLTREKDIQEREMREKKEENDFFVAGWLVFFVKGGRRMKKRKKSCQKLVDRWIARFPARVLCFASC